MTTTQQSTTTTTTPPTPRQIEIANDLARRLLLEQRARAKAAEAQAKLDARPFGPDYP